MRRMNVVKVVATTTAAAMILTVGWLAVANAAGGPNLSLGKATSASSTNAGFGSGNLNDGNQGSYWESTNNAFPQWAQIDLGASTSIDQVILKLPSAWGTRTQTLSIQGSRQWLDLHDDRGLRRPGVHPGQQHGDDQLHRDEHPVRAGEHHREHGLGGGAAVRAGDLRRVDLLGRTWRWARRCRRAGHSQNYVAANANDANQATYWESVNNAFPQHLQVDLALVGEREPGGAQDADLGVGGPHADVERAGRRPTGRRLPTSCASAAYTFQPASANTVTINFGQTTPALHPHPGHGQHRLAGRADLRA